MQVFIFFTFEFMFLPQCLVTVLVNSLLCIVCAIVIGFMVERQLEINSYRAEINIAD